MSLLAQQLVPADAAKSAAPLNSGIVGRLAMVSAYDSLVETGAIGSLKRDIMLGSEDDVFFLCHITKWFRESAGEAGAREALPSTVRVVRELVDQGLCTLATWSGEGVSHRCLSASDSEVLDFVVQNDEPGRSCFDHFLVATDRGAAWVARYETLVREL